MLIVSGIVWIMVIMLFIADKYVIHHYLFLLHQTKCLKVLKLIPIATMTVGQKAILQDTAKKNVAMMINCYI
jgi:hypothetical protein